MWLLAAAHTATLLINLSVDIASKKKRKIFPSKLVNLMKRRKGGFEFSLSKNLPLAFLKLLKR